MANPNIEVLERIYLYVELNPGCLARDVSRGIGLVCGSLDGRCASMENVGLLLFEDLEGRLYPYTKYGEASEWWAENTEFHAS